MSTCLLACSGLSASSEPHSSLISSKYYRRTLPVTSPFRTGACPKLPNRPEAYSVHWYKRRHTGIGEFVRAGALPSPFPCFGFAWLTTSEAQLFALFDCALRYHSMSCFGLPPAPPDLLPGS